MIHLSLAEMGMLALIIALVAFTVAKVFDHDAGGYKDGFFTKGTFPDKAVHAVCGFGLALSLCVVEGKPSVAALTTLVAGALYEMGQGYFSWYDLVADVLGAIVAGVFYHFITGAI